MIYLFTWNNRYLIRQEAQKWKDAFEEKYGSENIIHITSLEWVSKAFLSESLLSRGLFSEKRLVLIDWFPFSWEKNFSWASELESYILDSLEQIPEDVLLVFLSVNPDKRKTWFKKLSKVAEVKNFSVSSESEVFDLLQKKYQNKIDSNALNRLIFIKWGDLQKSISEIEKLSITKDKIALQDVEEVLIPEFEESIFAFIDTLLKKDTRKIFSEFENLLSFSNLYALYQSILANLRVFLYIELLKSQKKSSSEISDILKLWNRSFLLQKKHRSGYGDISRLYANLLQFDKNMKFWKYLSSDEEDLKKQLEMIFIRFTK